MTDRPRSHLYVAPVELETALDFIARLHRHNRARTGHRFSIGAFKPDGELVGVAISGRPKARAFNPLEVLEVSRLCTDGTPNACSLLYAACARVATAWGFHRIQSYILESESGASLRAAGWACLSERCGSGDRKWSSSRRPRAEVNAERRGQLFMFSAEQGVPRSIPSSRPVVPELVGLKQLWGKDLNK